MKKVLLNKIEIYKIDHIDEDLDQPFAYLAVSDDIKCHGWTAEDAVKQLLKKLFSVDEHREWAIKNGWIAPKLK